MISIYGKDWPSKRGWGHAQDISPFWALLLKTNRCLALLQTPPAASVLFWNLPILSDSCSQTSLGELQWDFQGFNVLREQTHKHRQRTRTRGRNPKLGMLQEHCL